LTAHRQIFRASAIIGAASMINMVIGVLKVKFLAIFLGPLGVGLLGLYQNIMGVATSLAGCGVANSGVRQLAIYQDDESNSSLVRKAMLYASLLLGLIGMALLWLFREKVAQSVFGNSEHATEIGYLGIGVFLSIFSAYQTAILQGMRRLGDLSRVQVLGALASAVIGIIAIWLWGAGGMMVFILTGPAASVMVAIFYTNLFSDVEPLRDWNQLRRQWQSMFSLGIPLMAAGLMTLVVQLMARSFLMQNIGLEATGYFQAAWVISTTYLGFLLNTMAVDYFPRLSSAIHDREQANRIVNEQTEMMLLLAGPVLIAMMAFAPWVIELLYSKSFSPAIDILRWQVLGDIIKVVSWPMGFIVVAQGRGGLFIGTQLNWNVVYLGILWFGLPEFGLVITGVGFFIAYIAHIVVVYFVARKLIDFKIELRNLWLFLSLLVSVVIIYATSIIATYISYMVGLFLAMSVGFYSFRRLNTLMNLSEWIKKKFERPAEN